MFKKVYLYIAKKFFLTFILVVLSVSTLISIVNIFELLGKVVDKPITWWQIVLLDILPVASFVDSIVIFLIMLSAMISLFSLSIRSEILIMRSSGLSLLQIITPVALSSFLIGIFFILVFNPFSIIANKKFHQMEQKLIDNKELNLLSPAGGIWIKQNNLLENNQEIIIRADKIYRTNLKMENVTLWFFDSDYKFYKRIDAKSVFLKEGFWYLENTVINDSQNINVTFDNFKVATKMKADFFIKKILNNFEDVDLFSVYDLPFLINDIKDSGTSPRKFIVYYYSMLERPFLLVSISLIAAYFAINNIRNKNNFWLFIIGVVLGLIVHISVIVINQLGSSGIIPIFLSTWMVVIILLTTSILLIFKKEFN